ncbi:MAG: peptidase [candidate division Zixibacteria bacterium]|nr:peptidase [candidate division Zixibacteria bacterium]
MSILREYLDRNLNIHQIEAELLSLISDYNKLRDSYLLVYTVAIHKNLPEISLQQQDYYIIHDLLMNHIGQSSIDVYLETPGGSGETAEEIARFLHNNFDKVNFVITGEAKSAGTILSLSGHEIFMSETGSLGPIDAQMMIGRSYVSAHDYMEWVRGKQEEAESTGMLNPFDATMVAQITPGELLGVQNALEYAKDLVKEWLESYKFRNWEYTESRGVKVTEKMKKQRAEEIATILSDHSHWRTHGRSIKIDDLEDIGLRINRIDNDKTFLDLVQRIQILSTLFFDSTPVFKILATEHNKFFRSAIPVSTSQQSGISGPFEQHRPDVVKIEQKCPKCGIVYRIYAKFVDNSQIDDDFQAEGYIPFPKDNIINCSCGFRIDLTGLKNKIESESGLNIIISGDRDEKQ